MRYGKFLLQCVALVAAAGAARVQADVPRYRVEVIGSLLNNTQSSGLNDLGQVVGTRWFGEDKETGGFIYSDGRVTRLQGLGFLPQALDINNHGDIVGSDHDRLHNQFAFLYRAGRITDISSSLGPRIGPATAMAVNNHGHAVGTASSKAFFYDGTSSQFITHEGLGNAAGVTVSDLNDRDAVVGWTYDVPAGQQFSFVYHDGELTKIPGLADGADTNASAVNNLGQAVGLGLLASGAIHPFFYNNGVTVDLGTLGGEPEPGDGSAAGDINDRGWIVGSSFTPELRRTGFLYADGQMHNMNALLSSAAATQWHVEGSYRINEVGQILAYGQRADSGLQYSLLLSPVPEPQAWALLLAGLGVVGAAVRVRAASTTSAGTTAQAG